MFVYFAGHGKKGYLCIERGNSNCHWDTQLRAPELNKAIRRMHERRKYKAMLFYVEACHSGSLFEVN